LRVLIGELGVPRQQHRDLARCAEEQILHANLTYYDELKSCLAGLSVDDHAHSAIRANFIRLCDEQVARIVNHQRYATGCANQPVAGRPPQAHLAMSATRLTDRYGLPLTT